MVSPWFLWFIQKGTKQRILYCPTDFLRTWVGSTSQNSCRIWSSMQLHDDDHGGVVDVHDEHDRQWRWQEYETRRQDQSIRRAYNCFNSSWHTYVSSLIRKQKLKSLGAMAEMWTPFLYPWKQRGTFKRHSKVPFKWWRIHELGTSFWKPKWWR